MTWLNSDSSSVHSVLPRAHEDWHDSCSAFLGVAVGGARGLGKGHGCTDQGDCQSTTEMIRCLCTRRSICDEILQISRMIAYLWWMSQEDSYVNNACLDYLDDSLEKRFSSTKSLDSDPSTPPKSSDNIVSTFSPEKEVIAAAVSVPARRRKCLITRIEAFSSSHTLENCNWQE